MLGLVGIDDNLEVYRSSTQCARKSYKCGECRKTIYSGDTYRRDFSVQHGHASTAFLCKECNDLEVKFFATIPREYKEEITYETGYLKQAVIDLREEMGAMVNGFKYPPCEVIQLKKPNK